MPIGDDELAADLAGLVIMGNEALWREDYSDSGAIAALSEDA
jgi:hypothetical protein